MKSTNLLLSILMIGLFACSKDEPLSTNEPDPTIVSSEVPLALEAFAGKLFSEVLAQETANKNVVISPLSVAAALYMTHNGADGSTQTAMSEALALNNMTTDMLNAAFAALSDLLQQSTGNTQLRMANAMFWDENEVNPDSNFISLLQGQYQAETFSEDFSNNSDRVLNRINTWVNEKTEGKIDQILEELDPQEVMFLVNALYFIGDWDQPFAEETTSDRDFKLRDGGTIQVPTMYQDNELRVLMNEEFSAVELAFDDPDYAMQFVLPADGVDIINWLNVEKLTTIQKSINDGAKMERVLLSLPKFEINYKITLDEVLKALGMEIAFNPLTANFAKIGSFLGGIPYLSRVEHKTFLKIDEKGAEGAAVTTVGIGVKSTPPAIDFNRPFMISLVHKPTKTQVFTGIIQNPEEVN